MKLYLVRWRQRCYYNEEEWERDPQGPRVLSAFTSREQAEQDRLLRESERTVPANRTTPPACVPEWADLEDFTSFPEPVLIDWLTDAGLAPPPPGEDEDFPGRDWIKWWSEALPTWPEEEQARAWKALDRISFFEVVETELEE
jgi:hypothetical protein